VSFLSALLSVVVFAAAAAAAVAMFSIVLFNAGAAVCSTAEEP